MAKWTPAECVPDTLYAISLSRDDNSLRLLQHAAHTQRHDSTAVRALSSESNIYPPPRAAFHVNSSGGTDNIDYSSWPNGLNAAGLLGVNQ